jgi:hypothetical protein
MPAIIVAMIPRGMIASTQAGIITLQVKQSEPVRPGGGWEDAGSHSCSWRRGDADRFC